MVSKQIDETEQTWRARGFRLTKPRRLILDIVHASQLHPSAYDVYRRVRRKLPHVSLGTVYRNLRLLIAEGLLRERLDASGVRFDPNTAPHDHFTCIRCRRVYDIAPNRDASIQVPVRALGFQVFEHQIEFYGRCRVCHRRRVRRRSQTSGSGKHPEAGEVMGTPVSFDGVRPPVSRQAPRRTSAMA